MSTPPREKSRAIQVYNEVIRSSKSHHAGETEDQAKEVLIAYNTLTSAVSYDPLSPCLR